MAFLMDPTMQEFKLKHLLLKLFEITISYHSSGVNTLQCHFMYKNLKSFVSRCECVSCFDFVSKPSVNNYMRGSNGGTADPDLRPSILNCATLSEPPWSPTRHPLPS